MVQKLKLEISTLSLVPVFSAYFYPRFNVDTVIRAGSTKVWGYQDFPLYEKLKCFSHFYCDFLSLWYEL